MTPAGPVVRFDNNEVGIIPDSQPIVNTRAQYDKALDVNLPVTNPSGCDHHTDSSNSDSSHSSPIQNAQVLHTGNRTHDTNVASNRTAPNSATAHKQTEGDSSEGNTPFSSTTDLSCNAATGAIPQKPSFANNLTQQHPPMGCVPITNFFKSSTNTSTTQVKAPNICSWRENPIPSTSWTTPNPRYVTNPITVPLTQRQKCNCARRNSTTAPTNTVNTTPVNTEPRTYDTDRSDNNSYVDLPANNTTNGNPTSRTDTHGNKNVSFTLQREQNSIFLPIPAEGLPFFRRARGCFSAEARAHTRAEHLTRLSDNGRPPRWAYGIGQMPSFGPLAKELITIKRRHAIELARAVARSLNDSAITSRRQGNLNLDTVRTIFGADDTGYQRATEKLTTLVERDNGQEQERLVCREELINRSPTTDEDITNHVSGNKVAAKSYAGAIANDPLQGNALAQANPPANRNAQPRSNRRNRSRNERNRDNRNTSRSSSRGFNQNRRAANPSRGNGGRNSRNRYMERDSAFDYMEKMMDFFSKRR